MTPFLACPVCNESFEQGDPDLGCFEEEGAGDYLCCTTCAESGRHERWRAMAIEALQSSGVAFASKGNLAADYRTLVDYQKHSARLADGVCPNGCARLVNNNCPVCGFTYQTTSL